MSWLSKLLGTGTKGIGDLAKDIREAIKGKELDPNKQLAKAADIVIESKSPEQVANIIKALISEGKMKQGGISAYNTFTHYDIRGHKARW